VSFAAITLWVAFQRVFVVVYFVMTQPGNFWIHPRKIQVNISERRCHTKEKYIKFLDYHHHNIHVIILKEENID
jgi:hypothetical protein